MANLANLELRLGYKFNNLNLLKQALTHRSYSKDNYERLEFVGDVILDLAISMQLYKRFPELPEGSLSKMRAALVNQDTLVSIATRQLELGDYLCLGDGEIKSGGKLRPSILADALEAILAAISFDSSLNVVNKLIDRLYQDHLVNCQQLLTKDSKSILQEYLQARRIPVPNYTIIDTKGPEHDNIFVVECIIPELAIQAKAYGKNKKEASQLVAEQILTILNKGNK